MAQLLFPTVYKHLYGCNYIAFKLSDKSHLVQTTNEIQHCDEVQIKSVSLSLCEKCILLRFQIFDMRSMKMKQDTHTKQTKRKEKSKYNTEQNITKYLHTNELHRYMIMPLPLHVFDASLKKFKENSQRYYLLQTKGRFQEEVRMCAKKNMWKINNQTIYVSEK